MDKSKTEEATEIATTIGIAVVDQSKNITTGPGSEIKQFEKMLYGYWLFYVHM